MTNTKNCGSKNSTKNTTNDKQQHVAVNKTTTGSESSMKDTHTLDETSYANPDDSERRDGPGGN